MDDTLTSELLIRAYCAGVFPMAESDESVYWYAPDPRAVLPIEEFSPGRRLRALARKQVFEIRSDTVFEQVMRGCARRDETWISEPLVTVYTDLHRLGLAHSVECFQDDDLVGGLYGVALGGAFFGESMFSAVSGASKVALVHLVDRLRMGGYQLLDIQFITPHLARFGAIEIPKAEYEDQLAESLVCTADWTAIDQP